MGALPRQRLSSALDLPLGHTSWFVGCAAALAILLGARQLHYTVAHLPAWLDRALGVLLTYEVLLFFGAWIAATMFLEILAGAILLALGWQRRRLLVRYGERRATSPWLHSLIWSAIVLGHAALDLSPRLAALCWAGLPLLMVPVQSRLRGLGLAALAAAALAAVAYAAADGGGWSAGALALWLCGLALLVGPGARRLLFRDRLWIAVVGIAAVQVAAALGPSLLPTHQGRPLIGEMAYSFCESPRHQRLYAALTACSTLPNQFRWRNACKRGSVAEFDLRDLSLRARHRFFSPDYYGRLEQLVCLDDTVEIGLNGVVAKRRESRDGAIGFDILHPERFTQDPVGRGQGHRIAYDEKRDALFYAPEWGQGIVRHPRGTRRLDRVDFGAPERPWLPIPGGVRDSFEFGPESIHRGRDSLFLAEWIGGSVVREIDMEALRLVATYPHHNGGAVGITVDEAYDRLYVVGLWGMGVFDLSLGRFVWKTRLGLLSRAPVIDAERGLVYVASTVEGRIRVFDRATLAPRGSLPIGFGVRLLHLSPSLDRLFASNWRAAFSWPAEQLAK